MSYRLWQNKYKLDVSVNKKVGAENYDRLKKIHEDGGEFEVRVKINNRASGHAYYTSTSAPVKAKMIVVQIKIDDKWHNLKAHRFKEEAMDWVNSLIKLNDRVETAATTASASTGAGISITSSVPIGRFTTSNPASASSGVRNGLLRNPATKRKVNTEESTKAKKFKY